MAHSHSDGHDHRHISADRHAAENERRLFLAMLITGVFMVVEVIGGLYAGSLALLADAGHMLTDTAALGLAWLAFRVGRRPSDPLRSYGYHRFQVLAAFVNGLTLLAIGIWIVVEAFGRLMNPIEVLAGPMLVVAVAGLLVNVGAFAVLHAGGSDNLNLRGAALHVMGDLLGSVAAIVAAVLIMATGWSAADPALSLVVAVLIFRGAISIVRRSGHILLEGTPEGLEPEEIKTFLEDSVPGISDIHHVHAWSLTDERPIVTLHARLARPTDHADALARINALLHEKFGVGHVTAQIEYGECPDE